jgi:hypothetical protein
MILLEQRYVLKWEEDDEVAIVTSESTDGEKSFTHRLQVFGEDGRLVRTYECVSGASLTFDQAEMFARGLSVPGIDQ